METTHYRNYSLLMKTTHRTEESTHDKADDRPATKGRRNREKTKNKQYTSFFYFLNNQINTLAIQHLSQDRAGK